MILYFLLSKSKIKISSKALNFEKYFKGVVYLFMIHNKILTKFSLFNFSGSKFEFFSKIISSMKSYIEISYKPINLKYKIN